MAFLKHMRIWAKIVFALSLFALLSTGLVAFAAYNIADLAAGTQHIVHHQANSLRAAAATQERLSRMHQIVYAMTNAASSEWGVMQTTFDGEAKEAKQELKVLQTGASAAEAAQVAEAASD